MKNKLSIIAIAVAAASVSSFAMAGNGVSLNNLPTAKIYGQVHLAADKLSVDAPAGSAESDVSDLSFASKASKVGVNGFHPLSVDTNLIYQLEYRGNFSTGDSSSSGFDVRNSYLGVSNSKLGTVKAGRIDSPFQNARSPANLFENEVGDMRNITLTGDGAFEDRYDNTVSYTSPTINGVTASVGYSEHKGVWDESRYDNAKSVSASLSYTTGPLNAVAAYESVDEVRGKGNRESFSLAGSYDISENLKAVGFLQTTDVRGADLAYADTWTGDVYGAGLDYSITSKTSVKGMWLGKQLDADDADSSMFVVGVNHQINAPLSVYANYAVSRNDDNSKSTPWGQGRSDAHTGFNGETANAISVGMKYDF